MLQSNVCCLATYAFSILYLVCIAIQVQNICTKFVGSLLYYTGTPIAAFACWLIMYYFSCNLYWNTLLKSTILFTTQVCWVFLHYTEEQLLLCLAKMVLGIVYCNTVLKINYPSLLFFLHYTGTGSAVFARLANGKRHAI